MYMKLMPRRKTMAKKTESGMLSISIPRSSMTDDQISNLKALVRSKRSLIQDALRTDSLEIIVDDEKISFPWFESDAEGMKNYTIFITALCDTARKLHRVNTKEEKAVENKKYAFRCFLLRLGLIGDSYKETRKVLMRNLSGSAAFRTPVVKEVAV